MNTKLYTLLAVMAALIGSGFSNLTAYHGNGYYRGGHHHGGHGGAVAAGVAGGVVGGAILGSAIAADRATAPVNPYYYDDEPGYYAQDEYVDRPVEYVDEDVDEDEDYARSGRYHDTRAPRSDSNKRTAQQKHLTETGRESRNSNQQRRKDK